MKKLISLVAILFLTAAVYAQSAKTVSIEGHRGARGWVPENTIPSFKKALQLGADVLELDVVVTKDGKLVVSHEPWFSSKISTYGNGAPIPAGKEKEFNIYKMTYDQVRTFDVGSIGNPDFPQQEKMRIEKPLLSDVFREIAKFGKANKLTLPRYNIEIKSSPEGDNIFHPVPTVFAKMLFDQIVKSDMQSGVIVQSFDVRALQEMRKLSKSIPLSYLVGDTESIETNIAQLGFQPEIYSPNFRLVTAEAVAYCHERGIKIVPRTVNEIADLENMKKLDLDGIITDYPDRAVKVFKN